MSDDQLFAEGLGRLVAAEENLIALRPLDRPLTEVRLECDVVLVDSRLEGATALAGDLPGGRPALILVSAQEDNEWTVRALAAGARGVLGKAALPNQLAKAIRVVHEGEIWASRRSVAAALGQLAAMARPAPSGAPDWESRLSTREGQVMQMAARGLTNRQLARDLAISGATVKAHLNRIFRKLGVHNRAELASVCLGLRSPEASGGSQRPEARTAPRRPSTIRRTLDARSNQRKK